MTWTCRDCHATIRGLKPEHCAECHETFTGTRSGDMHRTGRHGVTGGPDRRRCLTTAKMAAKGMTRNRNGYWTTGNEFRNAAESFRGENSSA